jgi:hypothetical protein
MPRLKYALKGRCFSVSVISLLTSGSTPLSGVSVSLDVPPMGTIRYL